MPSWRRIFTSEEARIESKAGAVPPNWRPEDGDPAQLDWPLPAKPPFAGDDENDEAPSLGYIPRMPYLADPEPRACDE